MFLKDKWVSSWHGFTSHGWSKKLPLTKFWNFQLTYVATRECLECSMAFLQSHMRFDSGRFDRIVTQDSHSSFIPTRHSTVEQVSVKLGRVCVCVCERERERMKKHTYVFRCPSFLPSIWRKWVSVLSYATCLHTISKTFTLHSYTQKVLGAL